MRKAPMTRLARSLKTISPIFTSSSNNSTAPMTLQKVTVEQGVLEGATLPLPWSGGNYFSFKGIPYARPPLGELRFKAPEPPLKWRGVRDAKEHGATCPQMDMFTGVKIEGDEDCLFLNVYTPNTKPSGPPAPVMVWLHGGAFMSGSGDSDIFGPEFLVSNDVVVVTVNYRLEVLGFLCLDTEEVPGNAGMKDQVAALEWVRDNIAHFGGDPGNVTLFGESAGGVSVTYHMASHVSRGLFHKAIAQSGVYLCDWAQGLGAKERAFRLGKFLGKETEDPNELLKFLQSLPTSSIVKVTGPTMTVDEKRRGLPIHFCPVIEKNFKKNKQFLTEDPASILAKGNIANVPFIVGYNDGEGILPLRDNWKKRERINGDFECKVPREVALKVPLKKSQEFSQRIKKFYFGNKDITEETLQSLIDLESDILFTYNTNRFLNLYSQTVQRPVYLYEFTCLSELNIPKLATGFSQAKGASHADDLFYLFKAGMLEKVPDKNSPTGKMIYQFAKLWTNFAKTGNPTPDTTLGVKWKQYNKNEENYLDIGSSLVLRQRPHKERIEFWNEIYTEASKNKIKSAL